eukprot:m.14173 g.14173  ORF g.14173 m.14173 type:complete len:224 (+) comp8842_c0_seq1:136-807(+)
MFLQLCCPNHSRLVSRPHHSNQHHPSHALPHPPSPLTPSRSGVTPGRTTSTSREQQKRTRSMKQIIRGYFRPSQVICLTPWYSGQAIICRILEDRLLTFVGGFASVAMWRGVWHLWDIYSTKDLEVSGWVSTITGIVFLLLLGSFRSVLAPPIGAYVDDNNMTFPTWVEEMSEIRPRPFFKARTEFMSVHLEMEKMDKETAAEIEVGDLDDENQRGDGWRAKF